MRKKKKGDISIQMIVLAILALIVLVILVFIFRDQIKKSAGSVSDIQDEVGKEATGATNKFRDLFNEKTTTPGNNPQTAGGFGGFRLIS